MWTGYPTNSTGGAYLTVTGLEPLILLCGRVTWSFGGGGGGGGGGGWCLLNLFIHVYM